MDFAMNFSFNYGGQTLNKPEADALFQAATSSRSQPFEIDLSKLIDVRVVDSNKLFELSVYQHNPTLASLAFKLATATPAPAIKAPIKAPTTKKSPASLLKPGNADDIIADLNKSACYRSVGAALLLQYADLETPKVMRDTAVEFANDCLTTHKVKPSSIVYKGFTLTNLGLAPTDISPDVPRRATFHVSPVYLSLREGLAYCEHNGLLSIRRHYSSGSHRTDVHPIAEKLKRMYYTFVLTDKGAEVKESWGDMETFIVKFFKNRHV